MEVILSGCIYCRNPINIVFKTVVLCHTKTYHMIDTIPYMAKGTIIDGQPLASFLRLTETFQGTLIVI